MNAERICNFCLYCGSNVSFKNCRCKKFSSLKSLITEQNYFSEKLKDNDENGYCAAGILPYFKDENGIKNFLFVVEKRNNNYKCNFIGGKREVVKKVDEEFLKNKIKDIDLKIEEVTEKILKIILSDENWKGEANYRKKIQEKSEEKVKENSEEKVEENSEEKVEENSNKNKKVEEKKICVANEIQESYLKDFILENSMETAKNEFFEELGIIVQKEFTDEIMNLDFKNVFWSGKNSKYVLYISEVKFDLRLLNKINESEKFDFLVVSEDCIEEMIKDSFHIFSIAILNELKEHFDKL